VRHFVAQGSPTVSLKRAHGHSGFVRYKKGEFDFLIGYDLYSDTAYVWSWDELRALKTNVSIAAGAAERWDKLR